MHTLQLNTGNLMPLLGFGVYQITDPAECESAIKQAIDVGYRLIDTASAYGNEESVGRAIKASSVARTELFITTKLWIKDVGYDQTFRAVETSLKKLNLDYLDLYLIHQPLNDIYGAWRAMESLHQQGVLKNIGVSNFHTDRVADLMAFNQVAPAVNQIEYNPFYQRKSELTWLNNKGVQVQSWASFAEGKHAIFSNPVLKDIADKFNKSIAQVVLRWLVQQNIMVIPKSITPSRIRENFAIFDFVLNDIDMQKIASLDKEKSCFFSHRDPATIEFLASR
jgi:2,5-diketo-D-gluconate reductase A